jgi:hypothetical protein
MQFSWRGTTAAFSDPHQTEFTRSAARYLPVAFVTTARTPMAPVRAAVRAGGTPKGVLVYRANRMDESARHRAELRAFATSVATCVHGMVCSWQQAS